MLEVFVLFAILTTHCTLSSKTTWPTTSTIPSKETTISWIYELGLGECQDIFPDTHLYIGDNICDDFLNIMECKYDDGDCCINSIEANKLCNECKCIGKHDDGCGISW